MTLLDLRKRLIEASGRTDLVVNTQEFSDDGADYFIRAGQRFLDDLLPTQKSSAEVVKSVGAGDASVSFLRVRAVLKVRVRESGKKPEVLDELPLFKFYDKYGDLSYIKAEADRGKPKRYAVGILRDSSPSSTKEEERQILLHPPSDGSYDIVLTARYFSAELSSDSDESWWSLTYPDLLIAAARRRIEMEHRNRQGAEEFEARIRSKVQDIDSNLVEEDSSGISQMTDAWRRRS